MIDLSQITLTWVSREERKQRNKTKTKQVLRQGYEPEQEKVSVPESYTEQKEKYPRFNLDFSLNIEDPRITRKRFYKGRGKKKNLISDIVSKVDERKITSPETYLSPGDIQGHIVFDSKSQANYNFDGFVLVDKSPAYVGDPDFVLLPYIGDKVYSRGFRIGSKYNLGFEPFIRTDGERVGNLEDLIKRLIS